MLAMNPNLLNQNKEEIPKMLYVFKREVTSDLIKGNAT